MRCGIFRLSHSFPAGILRRNADDPYADLRTRSWITLGGAAEDTEAVAGSYRGVYSGDVTILQSDSGSAELAKYMTNAFLAAKVIFCNEMYDIAARCGISYEEARRLWLADGRIGESHTRVFPDAPRVWRLLLPEGCPRPALHRAVRGAFFAPAGGNAAAECRLPRGRKKSLSSLVSTRGIGQDTPTAQK